MASYEKLDSKCNRAPLLTAVSMGFSISSSSEDNVASAILFTHSPQATPTSFPGLFPSRGGRPHENGKALGTRLRLRPHDTHSKGKNMSFTRKMFRILTKRILTCLFKKGVIQHFGSK